MEFIDFLNTHSNIIQIVLGVLSLIATVFISFWIHWLQTRHEKEVERNEIKAHEDAVAEAGKVFLIDHHVEVDYLPLAVMAASVKRYVKQRRSIYANFCKCSAEQQAEILKQARIPIFITDGSKWVHDVIEHFIEDSKKYKLFYDYSIYYDGAQYFFRGFDRYANNKIDSYIMDQFDVPHMNAALYTSAGNNRSKLELYIDRYLEFVLQDMEDTKDRPELLPQEPPFDMIWRTQNLANCQESDVCFWAMKLIQSSCVAFFRHDLVSDKDSEWRHTDTGDAQMETFEDMYYFALLWLFETYADSPNGEAVPAKRGRQKNKS